MPRPPTHCNACNRAYKQIKPHLKTKKHAKNTLLLQQRQQYAAAAEARLQEPQEPQEIHECSICLDEISSNKLQTTQCGHHFHKDCLDNWRRMKNSCPNCRHNLPQLQRPAPQVPRERAIAAAIRRNNQRERPIIRPNYNLINVLIETITIFEQFDHIDPNVLNNARFRLMQLLNN